MRPRFKVSSLKALVELIQPLVISIAVIVGGVWTMYTFRAQLYVENAQAQLDKLKREIEAEPRLEIDIDTVQLDVPGSDVRHVLGTIRVKNVGSANTLLSFQQKPVQIYRVTVGRAGEVWTDMRSVGLQERPRARTAGLMCHASATTHVQFIATLDAAGLYVVNFAASRNAAETAAVIKAGGLVSGERGIYWRAAHYFTLR